MSGPPNIDADVADRLLGADPDDDRNPHDPCAGLGRWSLDPVELEYALQRIDIEIDEVRGRILSDWGSQLLSIRFGEKPNPRRVRRLAEAKQDLEVLRALRAETERRAKKGIQPWG